MMREKLFPLSFTVLPFVLSLLFDHPDFALIFASNCAIGYTNKIVKIYRKLGNMEMASIYLNGLRLEMKTQTVATTNNPSSKRSGKLVPCGRRYMITIILYSTIALR
jgi:hypothetical protein